MITNLKTRKKTALFFWLVFFLFTPTLAAAKGLVPCGGIGEAVCTLCHLIIGIKGLIDWGFTILVFIALLAIVIAGIMYIVSAGNDQEMEKAKNMIKQTLTGSAIVFGAWLLINTTILLLGTQGDMGVQATGWSSFSCDVSTASEDRYVPGICGDGRCTGTETNATCPADCQAAAPVSGDISTLAAAVLSNGNIAVLNSGADCSGVTPFTNMSEARSGSQMTTCHDGCKSSGASCSAFSAPNKNMLQGLITASSSCKFTVQSIAGGDHGTDSKHYRGNAVDVTPNNCSMQQLKDIFSALPNKDGVICDVKGVSKPCSPHQSGMHVHASFR